MAKKKITLPREDRETITSKEAAEILGVHLSTLLDYVNRGWIEGRKKGLGLTSPTLIYVDSLRAFIEARKIKPKQ